MIGVSSGERVKVETSSQAGASDRNTCQLFNAVQALSANVSRIGADQQDIFAMVSIEDSELQLMVEKSQRRDLRFSG